MDQIEEQAQAKAKEAMTDPVGKGPAPAPLNPPLAEPPEGVVTQEDPPVSFETSLPSQEMTGVAVHSGGPTGNTFKPEPGYIRGQLMRQAAVLSEMDAFCSQNHGYLAGDALAQLKTAQNSIRAAWRSLWVAAVKLEE